MKTQNGKINIASDNSGQYKIIPASCTSGTGGEAKHRRHLADRHKKLRKSEHPKISKP